MSMRKLFLIGLLCATLMSMQAQEQVAIFFDSNKFDLTKAEQKRLSDWILSNKEVKIVAINGYTDEDGTNGFNDTLAKKRVSFIYNQIKDQVKIRDDFKTRSFGENFTQSKNKAENRKVTLYYILQKDLEREDEILGITPQIVEPLEIEPIEEESMNFPENATLEEKIALSRKGTLIRLSDINFYINTFAVMPTSKRSIDELIDIMNKNPKLKIEIQGHICCVNKDAKNLSTDRAKQTKSAFLPKDLAFQNPNFPFLKKVKQKPLKTDA
jgi:outer membrane protein OmpA-like peptidoglycan-associated protein